MNAENSLNWCKRLRSKRNSDQGSDGSSDKQEKTVVYNTRSNKQDKNTRSETIISNFQVDKKMKEKRDNSYPLIIGTSPSTQLKKVS